MSHRKYGVPTPIGYADPITGEQLDVTQGLSDAVDYYKPNANEQSFLALDSQTDGILLYAISGRTVTFAAHTVNYANVESVEWSFGDPDNSEFTTTATRTRFTYPENGEYQVTATVKFSDDTPDLELDAEVEIAAGTAPAATLNPSIVADDSYPGTVNTVDIGEWSGNPTSLHYRWSLDDDAIPYATQATYIPSDDDVGGVLTVTVYATNQYGTVHATSAGVTITAESVCEPGEFTTEPTVSGDPTVGNTVEVDMVWESSSPSETSFQWALDGTDIDGADQSTYTILEDDVGGELTVTVTASNECSTETITSPGVTVLPAE